MKDLREICDMGITKKYLNNLENYFNTGIEGWLGTNNDNEHIIIITYINKTLHPFLDEEIDYFMGDIFSLCSFLPNMKRVGNDVIDGIRVLEYNEKQTTTTKR